MRGSLAHYKTMLEDATRSDNQVRTKLLTHQDDIAQLGCTRDQLNGIMPKVDDIASAASAERSAVEDLIVATSNLKQSRQNLLQEITELAASLDVKGPLLRDSSKKLSVSGAHQLDGKDELFESTLEPVRDLATKIAESNTAQAELLEKLTAANTAFTSKQNDNAIVKRRGEILRGLQKGVGAYKEIEKLVQEGKTFYDQIRDRAREISVRVEDYKRMRDLEAREHIASINRAGAQTAPMRTAAPPVQYAPPPATSYGQRHVGGLPPAPANSGINNSAQFIGGARAVALPVSSSHRHQQQHQRPIAARPIRATPIRATPVQPTTMSAASRPMPTVVRAHAVPSHSQPHTHMHATNHSGIVHATPATSNRAPANGGSWTCNMCTFSNSKPEGLVCEMCNSQRVFQ